jgi:hypothetical protein
MGMKKKKPPAAKGAQVAIGMSGEKARHNSI